MTVSSQTSTATFVGNGVATAFPLPFRFFENGDIRAYFIDSVTGAAAQMVLGSDYTLIGAGEPEVDGNALSLLTTTVPLASMRGLYVERVMPQVQETDIVNQGEFFASTHEDVFDRLTMLIQQSNSNSQGAIRVAIGDPEPTRLVPAVSRANMLLGFDSSGNPIAVAPVSGSANDLAMSLSNFADLTKGANLVGRVAPVFKTIAEMKTVDGRYDGDMCLVLGYYSGTPGWGGGILRWDASSVLADDAGQTFIALAVTGRWRRVAAGQVSVADWGAYNDATNSSINDSALLSARNYVANTGARLVFPSGVYSYNVSPNWGIDDAEIVALGEVRLRYFGTGNAVILDAGPLALDLIFCVRMGRFIVEAPASAGHGVYVRSVHHSELDFRVDGCGATSAAFVVEFAACTFFKNPEASVNSAGGWYLGAKPKYGMVLDKRLANEQTAYCTIDNPIMEGVDIGINHLNSLGNMIRGGTLEGCTNSGAVLSATAVRDVYDHVDFEVNVGYDIYCLGNEIEIRSCDSDSIVAIAGGAFNRIVGGNFHNVQVDAATQNTRLESFVYNRAGTGGTLVDNGVATRKTNLQDSSKVYMHDAAPAVVGIAVTASPFNYVNTTGNDITVFVVGGTVSQVTTQAPGVAANATGQISGGFTLRPGWTIGVTYSALPAMLYTAG